MSFDPQQPDFFENVPVERYDGLRTGSAIDIRPLDATFRDSSRAPLHSWFPYLEGYSPRFVESVRMEFLVDAKRILEPFAGSGTTPIVLGQSGIECAYAEANPAMAFIVQTKLEILAMSKVERRNLSKTVLTLANQLRDRLLHADRDQSLEASYNSTFGVSVFFDELAFDNVLRVRTINDEVNTENRILGNCLTLATMASLIPSSRLKRSGDLRFRTLKELAAGMPCLIDCIINRLKAQSADIASVRQLNAETYFACQTAGQLRESVQGQWDGVITSPPYLNGTNYIRNARLELWYQRQIVLKSDLRRLRDGVITSGINDVDSQTDWRPVTAGVERVVAELEVKAYDQRISKMVGGYFRDMESAFLTLSECLKKRGRMCVDIGDSIYAGVHVRTDDLLVEVAEGIGLRTIERVHLRKRVSKGGQAVRQQLLIFEKQTT